MYDYQPKQWNAICDRCGFQYKSRQLRKEYTGLRVCDGSGTNECWERRHPQETRTTPRDGQALPWTRPVLEGADVSVGSGNEVDPADL